jgi:molybdenum cofactor synthesis domain-containing protein
MGEPKIVTAAVLIIGNEILSGRVADANINYLAKGLGGIGIRLMEVRVVRDDPQAIIDAVHALRKGHDYLFTTGGIGPTHDDITAECIAKAFGVELVRDARAVERLLNYYGKDELNDARLRMANIPAGSELIDNSVSHAPGFRYQNVYVLAGVPRIMQAMFESLKPGLAGGDVVLSRTLLIAMPESTLAEGLTQVQDRYPDVEIGSYPFVRFEKLQTAIVCRGTDKERIAGAIAEVGALATGLGGQWEEEGAA